MKQCITIHVINIVSNNYFYNEYLSHTQSSHKRPNSNSIEIIVSSFHWHQGQVKWKKIHHAENSSLAVTAKWSPIAQKQRNSVKSHPVKKHTFLRKH